MYPDFIGIGAQKAGTTWLHRNLAAHPRIWLPKKEIHYFDSKIKDDSTVLSRLFGKDEKDALWRRQVRNGLVLHTLKSPSPGGLRWTFKFYMRPYDDAWYGSIFEPKRGRLAGDITPAYSLLDRERVAHVHDLAPEAKLVFLMRNPIERAWSHTVMSLENRELGPAEYASEKKLLRWSGRSITRLLTDYQRTLENWTAFYPEERIFVGFIEDVHFFPGELLRRLYRFLGVDPAFKPPAPEEKVHSRSSDTMPARVAVHLANEYGEEAEALADRFGGYAAFWGYCARRLAEEPPEEERIAYPLWESFLWKEWVDGRPADTAFGPRSGPHSGPLPSVRVAG